IAPLLGFALLDRRPDAFPVIYATGAIIALTGVYAFSHVRLRGERELLKFESQDEAGPQPHGDLGQIYEYDPHSRPTFWTVLRKDRANRDYMLWQFVAGGSNMVGETMLIYIVADLTLDISNGYLVSILLTMAILTLLAMATLPLWARQLDKTHVARFR